MKGACGAARCLSNNACARAVLSTLPVPLCAAVSRLASRLVVRGTRYRALRKSNERPLHAPCASMSTVKLMSDFFTPPQSKSVAPPVDELAQEPAVAPPAAVAEAPIVLDEEEPEEAAVASPAVAPPPASAPAPLQARLSFPPQPQAFGLTGGAPRFPPGSWRRRPPRPTRRARRGPPLRSR